ncbi:MAG: hypothetical protein NZL98_04410, partial [Anaerolineales bacterium]|nr:hypothetical protein [Anaerolineales bacterium]MDW8226970.1 hypothetical protein [Anaerolineales bacterium]
MEEPSVLDYLKSKLRFWEKGPKIEIPPEAGEEARPVSDSASLSAMDETPEASPSLRLSLDWKGLPWRALLALALILLAQRTFEPSPERTSSSGLFLYALGLAWVLIASIRREWILSDLPETGGRLDAAGVRPVWLGVAVVLSVFAFLLFGGNQFTSLNVTLWLMALLAFVRAFWIVQPQAVPWWKR